MQVCSPSSPLEFWLTYSLSDDLALDDLVYTTVYLLMDELNKYAPLYGNNAITGMLLDIAERRFPFLAWATRSSEAGELAG